jgi:uncharacterized protein (DUF1499 family)
VARISTWLISLTLQLGIATYALHRLGWMSTGLALPLFAVAVLGALVAFVLGIAALWNIWQTGQSGAAAAGVSATLAAAILAGALVIIVLGAGTPAINDVSTDLIDPPIFDIIASRRPGNANSIAYPGAAMAEVQRTQYPDIRPLDTRRSAAEAYTSVLAITTKIGWRVVASGAPGERGPIGEIEATDKTLVMGFVDDITIRIKPLGQAGARIDIRSASRYGERDFGRNASRVREFLELVRRAIEAGELTTAE